MPGASNSCHENFGNLVPREICKLVARDLTLVTPSLLKEEYSRAFSGVDYPPCFQAF